MAIKEVVRIAKLEFLAGKSKPGPELAGLGIVMPEFTRQFNDQTKNRGEEPVPVTITVYKNKSFDFVTHTAPTAFKLKQAGNIEKGSSNSITSKVATVKYEQIKEIAEYKMPDLNTDSIESAIKIIAGTAKNMGILIEGLDDVEAEKAAAVKAAKAAKVAEAAIHKLEEEAQAAAESKAEAIEVDATAQKSDKGDE